MFRVYSVLIVLSLLFINAAVPSIYGAGITWDPNAETDLDGYKLYLGTESRQYISFVDLGNRVACDLSELFVYENAPNFLALTAYDTSGNESTFSNELSFELDDLIDHEDNCPDIYNPDQNDNYPPGGNNIGDACECEGDFSCDGDVDGWDAMVFYAHAGRDQFNFPCVASDPCYGDFDCDGDVDGWDTALFKADLWRNAYNKPCPPCAGDDWCAYP